ncbi:hypothetical protein Nocox_06240 [Nonomuraea coxensis DSM 45129]|uniref:FXSXX-COOH protein n=1 Tax=Nonomuraea coxensis DSM 45129 TaxID=1122611 RepID=A0ABX8TTR8_9ACTN|nr:hypothetical protein [Nonomuraea coxensis]QYC38875.1 hypothetical protein Nocox_06240 [Nonomuraea coxensis DSM 45129]
MGNENTTGLIDVSDVDLEDLRQLRNPALIRAMEQLRRTGPTEALFQSFIDRD